MLARIEISAYIADNSFICVKKRYFGICTKVFFTIYRVIYVIVLLHDNATTLRVLTCPLIIVYFCYLMNMVCFNVLFLFCI